MTRDVAYEHTQRTLVPFVIYDVTFMAVIFGLLIGGAALLPIIVTVLAFGVIAVIVITFSQLNVRVDSATVTARFGAGWPSKEIPLRDISAVTPVRNRWYHGWGMRKVPRGWMYNVWGLDAVELERTSGTVFRIGTDQPRELAAAIDAVTR